MLIELTLTHPCDETIRWSAGAYTDDQGEPIEHCPGCAEWLGTPFVRAEEQRSTKKNRLQPLRQPQHPVRAAG